MNPFDVLINDLFSAKDFTEQCKVNGKLLTCIVSSIATDTVVTRFGVDEGISFYLTIKATDYKPRKNDLIEYNNNRYKVDFFTLDSAGKTHAIYLRSVTTKG